MSLNKYKKYIDKIIDVEDLEVNKEYSRIARLHKYWARKPWNIINQYVSKYSKGDNLVLDPFMGSGSMGLEAILLGRDFIGYDLNPFACFLAKCTLKNKFDSKIYLKEFNSIKDRLKRKVMDLYKVGEDRYIYYSIKGSKNGNDYNVRTFDYNFRNKRKHKFSKKKLNSDVEIPKNFKYPDKRFPEQFYKDRFSYKGVSRVSDMYSSRNLYALATIRNFLMNSKLKYRDLFLLALSNSLLHASKLKSENVRPLGVNNYWIPNDYIDENVWYRFENRVKNVLSAKKSIYKRMIDWEIDKLGSFDIYNKSATDMNNIKNNSVDYIITDPPYGDAIQYSELSFIWNCWLEEDFDIEKEVIINPKQDKGIEEYSNLFKLFIDESNRVLKEGKYLTLCFQNKDIKVWFNTAEMMRKKGFQIEDISVYDTLGTPYNKNWSKFSPKSDFYITFINKAPRSNNKKSKVIEPEEIVKNVLSLLNDERLFNLNKAYDLFVAIFITELFNGNRISRSKKLNLKNIISMFKQIKEDGNIQSRTL